MNPFARKQVYRRSKDALKHARFMDGKFLSFGVAKNTAR